MEKVKLNILYNRYSGWYYATANRGREILVSFRPGVADDLWYFKMDERHSDIFIGGRQFPVNYFKQLCQAVWLIRYGVAEMPEIEFTVAGQKIINKIK